MMSRKSIMSKLENFICIMIGGAIKVNMNLLVKDNSSKDNLSRNMLLMRIKGGEPLNFLSEPMIKNEKGL